MISVNTIFFGNGMDFSDFGCTLQTLNTFLRHEIALTKEEYRRYVAIPRYLEKRAKRDFRRKVIHPSRVKAAVLKNRTKGKFACVSTP